MPERADRDKPRMHYLNLPKRFLAGIVIDPEEDEVLIGAKVTAQNVDTGEVLVTQTDDFGDFWFHQVAAGNGQVYFEEMCIRDSPGRGRREKSPCPTGCP